MVSAPGSDRRRRRERVRQDYRTKLLNQGPSGIQQGPVYVVFEVAGYRFAIRVTLCKGVLRFQGATPLPGLPEHLIGAAGIHGEVVSVVDTGDFLALPRGPREDRSGYLLIVSSDGVKAALRVDRVTEVVAVAEDEVVPAEIPWEGTPEGVVSGQWGKADPVVFLLDGSRLLQTSAAG